MTGGARGDAIKTTDARLAATEQVRDVTLTLDVDEREI